MGGRGTVSARTKHSQRAVALLADAPPSRAKARVLAGYAARLLLSVRYREAIQAGRDALAIAESQGLPDIRAQALNYIGSARVWGGDRGGFADLETFPQQLNGVHQSLRSGYCKGRIGSAAHATPITLLA